jgi:hypothetical protein
MALQMLLVTGALSARGFVVGVTADTVLAWLRRAAPQAHEIQTSRRRDRPVPPVQLAAMWHGIRRQQALQAGPDGESTAWSEDGRQGVGSSVAPEWRLLLAACVGPRTCDRAWPLLQRTAAVGWGVPGVCSAGCGCSLSALLAVSHPLTPVPRTGQPGRPTPPVQEPHPALVSGQVMKQKPQGRLQERVDRGRGGATRLEARGLAISPRVLARLNLPLRQAVAPLVRQSGSVWKERIQMRRRVVFLQAFDNCARPHRSWRVPLPEQVPQATGRIQPQWRHQTPGMAAGLTDHVWTFRELLTAKFEPLHNQSGSG